MSAINYQKVDWKDAPTHETPLNSSNLKKMDDGIFDLDNLIGSESEASDVSGDTVYKKINNVSSALKANGHKAVLTYSNGKYGFTIDGVFYQIGGSGMPKLDYAHPLHTFSSSLSYRTSSECWLLGSIASAEHTDRNITVTIDGTTVAKNTTRASTAYGAGAAAGGDVGPIKIGANSLVAVSVSSPDLHIFAEA